MRLPSCKIQCPLICFCKQSPHICTSGPLRLQNVPQLPSGAVSVPNVSHQSSAKATASSEVQNGSPVVAARRNGDGFRSSLKKAPSERNGQRRKQVQWMDFLGKELVEIREYASSEVDNTDMEGNKDRSCVCVILQALKQRRSV
ncbi:hypothetical protein SAY87_001774 [Trapa incisa]|uniref:Uncharacterized protein n=1 Tax=Trapa incisa TaxID=236973 RepID=A0AAN7JVV7_9MYRT|nr:hypothetical protein SAY87_001774 [Trapa incisa]